MPGVNHPLSFREYSLVILVPGLGGYACLPRKCEWNFLRFFRLPIPPLLAHTVCFSPEVEDLPWEQQVFRLLNKIAQGKIGMWSFFGDWTCCACLFIIFFFFEYYWVSEKLFDFYDKQGYFNKLYQISVYNFWLFIERLLRYLCIIIRSNFNLNFLIFNQFITAVSFFPTMSTFHISIQRFIINLTSCIFISNCNITSPVYYLSDFAKKKYVKNCINIF